MADPLLDMIGASQPAASSAGGVDPLLQMVGASMAPQPAVPASAPAAVKAGSDLNSIPRQLGLTARYGLEGLANAAQIVTEPLRYLQDKATTFVTGKPANTVPLGVLASQAADAIGLPTPQTSNERVVGDATKLLAGAGGMAGASQALGSAVGPVSNYVADTGATLFPKVAQWGANAANAARTLPAGLGANPLQQLTSAAGAGLAGGASREAGGNPVAQGVASLVGGVAGGLAPGAISGTVNTVRNFVNPANLNQQVEVTLQRAGVDLSGLPQAAQNSLRQDVANALRMGDDLNPDAVRRLADFRATNTTPTRGMVSLDPLQITKEQNLAKMAANSSDGSIATLPVIQNRNNAQLITNLNNAGASRGDLFAAGQGAINGIASTDASLNSQVNSLYQAARDLPGANIPLDRKTIVDNIYGALNQQNKLAYLPDDIAATINGISSGTITRNGQTYHVPFDANALDNLLTDISTAQRSTQDGNVRAALSIARNALTSSPITPVKNTFGGNQLVTQQGADFLRNQDAQAGTYLDALNQARRAAAQRFGWQESARPIEAALNGAQPDNFIKRFVIGGTVADAEAVANNAPVSQVRDAILAHLKEQALNGAADEVGKFSQSAFNKALNQIGDRKLSLFFSPEDLAALRANGRVASYMQVQPVGSAVNNSNSGALLLGKGYDLLKSVAAKVPFGKAGLLDPINNIEINLRNRQMQNVVPGLLNPVQQPPIGQSLMLPALAAGGLLASP